MREFINKIDFELKKIFDNVTINDISNKKEFLFEINVSKIVENKEYKILSEISKSNLNARNIEWSYYTDTNDKSSTKIVLESSIETLPNDMLNIISKKRFSTSYLISLNEVYQNDREVNEKTSKIEDKKLLSIIERFEINEESISIEKNFVDNVEEIKITLEKKMSPQDRYLIDLNFKSIGINPIYENDLIIFNL